MAGKYFFDTDYSYNVFGANEHLEVVLYRKKKDGRLKEIDSWSFATGIFPFEAAIARSRAERRIKKLRNLYGAKAL